MKKDDTINRVTAVAQEEAVLLPQFFNRIMLVWAKTAVLLKARGVVVTGNNHFYK